MMQPARLIQWTKTSVDMAKAITKQAREAFEVRELLGFDVDFCGAVRQSGNEEA